jgi:porin
MRRAAAAVGIRRICVLSAAIFFAPAGTARADDACAIEAACPGLVVDASFTSDLFDDVAGGARKGSALSHKGTLGVAWNAPDIGGVAHVTTSLSMMVMTGKGISGSRTGDLQGLNNIEAVKGLRLNEFWAEAHFGAGNASLRSGFLDLNADFDVPETSSLFVSPPHGIGTEFALSGSNGPAIFPVTGLGLRLQGSAREGLEWRVAAYEGEPGKADDDRFAHVHVSRDEGALLTGELSWRPLRGNKLQLGAWQYTARFEPLDPAAAGTRRRGNHGAYALVDMPVGHVGPARLDAALRYGVAAPQFNAVHRYAGLALSATHLATSLPDDAIGFALAHARTSSDWRAAMSADGAAPRDSETSLELIWRHALTGDVALMPHVHFVRSPGAVRDVRDAWVIGMRFEWTHSKRWLTSVQRLDGQPERVAQTSSSAD